MSTNAAFSKWPLTKCVQQMFILLQCQSDWQRSDVWEQGTRNQNGASFFLWKKVDTLKIGGKTLHGNAKTGQIIMLSTKWDLFGLAFHMWKCSLVFCSDVTSDLQPELFTPFCYILLILFSHIQSWLWMFIDVSCTVEKLTQLFPDPVANLHWKCKVRRGAKSMSEYLAVILPLAVRLSRWFRRFALHMLHTWLDLRKTWHIINDISFESIRYCIYL